MLSMHALTTGCNLPAFVCRRYTAGRDEDTYGTEEHKLAKEDAEERGEKEAGLKPMTVVEQREREMILLNVILLLVHAGT
jgi:hypothetical protein